MDRFLWPIGNAPMQRIALVIVKRDGFLRHLVDELGDSVSILQSHLIVFPYGTKRELIYDVVGDMH